MANTDANPLCKELRNRNISEGNNITKQQTFFYIKERRNPYETTIPIKFYNFTSCQLVGLEISAKILEFFDKGLTEYLMFPEERYLQKRNLKRMATLEFLSKKQPGKLVEHRRKLI